MKITIDEELDVKLDEKLDEKLKYLPTKDEFFGKMDEVMGELKTIRESQDLLTDRVYRNHEERIEKVEKKLGIQPAV